MGTRNTRRDAATAGAAQAPKSAAPAGWPLRIASASLYASLLFLYAPSLSFAPISLDDASLLERAAGQPPSSVWGYDHFGHLRPLKNLFFFALSSAPEAVPVFRALVLLVFLASVALVQRLATRRLESASWGLAAAAVWAFQPTLTSVVCWLAAANLAFCLLGLLAFATFAERTFERIDAPRALAWHTTFALVGLSIAVLSHELALLAPALLALKARALRNRRAWPLAIGSLACAAVLVALRAASTPAATSYRFEAYPAWLLSVSAARYALENLRVWLWPPSGFGVLYVGRPSEHLLASALCWVVVLTAVVAAVRAGRRDPTVAFGASWTALFLAPVTNLVPLGNTPVALHYLYIPSVGLALLIARGLQRAGARIAQRSEPRRSWLPALVIGVAVLVWLPEQRRELRAWGDEELLYEATLDNFPENVEARVNLVSTWIERGRYQQAAKLVAETLPLAPDDVTLIRNAFEVALRLKPPAEALAFADRHAAHLDLPVHDISRGALLEQLGRHDEARRAFQRAFERAETAQARLASGSRLVMVLVRTQRTTEASRLVMRLLEEHPGDRELLMMQQLVAAQAPR